MHSKMVLDNNNELVIKLDSDDLEKSLYYRDEGNVSGASQKKETFWRACNRMQLISISNDVDSVADERRRESVCARQRGEARHPLQEDPGGRKS